MTNQYINDDVNQGRYFPNESEVPVLVKYLQLYFSHPERSQSRQQVVQTVVHLLSPKNEHWNHRNVRLWFNNNKKVYLTVHSSSERKEAPQISQHSKKPIIKQPVRSQSVSHITSAYEMMVNDKSAFNMFRQPIPYSDHMNNSVSNINNTLSMTFNDLRKREFNNADKKAVELNISNFMIRYCERRYNQLFSNYHIQFKGTICDNKIEISNTNVESIRQYDIIDCAALTNCGKHAIVSYDPDSDEQYIDFGNDNMVKTGINFPVSSIVIDNKTDNVFINSCGVIKMFNISEKKEVLSFNQGDHVKYVKDSKLEIWNGNLVFVAGSSIGLWPLDNIYHSQRPEMGSVFFEIGFKKIDLIKQFGENICIASYDHHTPKVLSPNGNSIYKATSHMGGITALGSFGDEKFITGSSDSSIRVWDIREPSAVNTLLCHRGTISSVYGNEEKFVIVTGGLDNQIKVWDIRNNLCRCSLPTGYNSPISLAYNDNIVTSVISDIANETFNDFRRSGLTSTFVCQSLPNNYLATYNLNNIR